MGRGAGGGGGKSGTTRGVKWRSVDGTSAAGEKRFAGAPQKHIKAVDDLRLYDKYPVTPGGRRAEGYYTASVGSGRIHIWKDAPEWNNRHELGHLVANRFLTYGQTVELEALYKSEMARTRRGAARRDTYYSDRWITRYAATGAGEMFAEAYAILTIPSGPNREVLRTKMETYAPNVVAFMGNVL